LDRNGEMLAKTPPPAAPSAGPGAPSAGFGGGRGLRDGEQADSGKEKDKKANWKLDERLDLGRGAQTMATATKLGDFFQYRLDRPVTLPRQKSAMLPIVNKDVEAARVSIYNERTQARFPLLGLRFKNSSGLHLMQGPITVFEGSSYAGDARILD